MLFLIASPLLTSSGLAASPPLARLPETMSFGPVSAEASDALVTWEQVEAACLNRPQCDEADTDPKLKGLGQFCEASAWFAGGEVNLPVGDLPSPETIRLAGRCDAPALAPAPGSSAGSVSLGGLDQQSILLGATDYLLGRAEAEIRAYLVNQKLDQLCDSSFGKRALTQTCAAVHLSGPEIIASGAAILQAAVRKDTLGLPTHVAEFGMAAWNKDLKTAGAEEDKLKPLRESDDPLLAFAVSSRALELVLDGNTPASALAGWAASEAPDYLDCKERPVATGIYAGSLALATFPMTDQGMKAPWDSSGTLDASRLGYLGLALAIDMHARQLTCNIDTHPVAGFDRSELVAFISAVKDSESKVRGLVDEVRSLLARASLPDADKAKLFSDYAALAAESLHLIEAGLPLVDATPSEATQKRLRLAEESARSLAKADYGGFALLMLQLAAEVLPKDDVSAKSLASLTRTLVFAEALSQAKDPDGARNALEAWAAPLGSYARKHSDGGFYAGLGAYVGAGPGLEYIPNGGAAKKVTFVGVPTMALGVDFGGRYTERKGRHGYFGVVLTFVDLGPIASWRVQNCYSSGNCWAAEGETPGADTGGTVATPTDPAPASPAAPTTTAVDTTPKVKFDQVLSPGMGLAWAPWNAPFALVGRLVYAPDLRQITLDGITDLRHYDAVQASLSINVDIPLFP